MAKFTMEFSGTDRKHEFDSADIDKALEWAKAQGGKVSCIRTPWGTLQLLDDDAYNTAVGVF